MRVGIGAFSRRFAAVAGSSSEWLARSWAWVISHAHRNITRASTLASSVGMPTFSNLVVVA